jgi:hypothetical protein
MRGLALWNPTLTDRQRVLLHTQPLLTMRHNWSLHEGEGQAYDPLCLSMKLFDVIIDQSGFGDEVTREMVFAELTPVLQAVDVAASIPTDPERYQRVVDRLLGALLNESKRGESFAVEYSDFDADGAASRRSFSFKLLKEVHGYSGEISLQLSSEAINLFLNALDLDIESEQIANEAVVQFQLERGNFDKARASAETARARSMQYEQKIHRIIEQTKRDIRQVDWRHDVHRTLLDANDHVEARLRIEEDILRSARSKLTSIADDHENRPSLSAVVRLIDECRSRHLRLNKRLMTARGEFIEQQSRQCYADDLRRELINLKDEVLSPILGLCGNQACRISESVGHAFIGPVSPRVLSLRELLEWQLQPKRLQMIGEAPIEEFEIVDTNVEEQRFDDEVLAGCDKVIASLDGKTRLSSLLHQLEEDGCPETVQDAVTLRILEHFDDEDDHSTMPLNVQVAEVDGLRATRCTGDDLLIAVGALESVDDGEFR